MKLVKAEEKYGCVVASVAMLRGESYWDTRKMLPPWTYPFEGLYASCPKVPAMEELVDIFFNWGYHLVPFFRDPYCSPEPHCNPVPVWPDGETKFQQQLLYGRGLLVGHCGKTGHMAAWDGHLVYDPRGMVYSLENQHCFDVEVFWLCT